VHDVTTDDGQAEPLLCVLPSVRQAVLLPVARGVDQH